MTDNSADICIIGAGSSGIAVAKALHDKGLTFDIYEKGSDIGGMWRYGNDNGLSCAYRSTSTPAATISAIQIFQFPQTSRTSSRIGNC
jgi:cation diffusion facilitator CzcD-associated flavoprotein CzcO